MSAAPGSNAVSDEEIVRRVQRGEGKLFAVIFERHYARLERFCRHLGVPEADLEDVLGEAFVRAFSRVHSFDPDNGTRYVSYLYAIARNLATDRMRQRGRMPEMLLLDEAWSEPDVDGESPVERVLHQEEIGRIRAALGRLSPSDREIITLSYDRELSCREIMEIMGKPSITSVTTHLYKAMKRLRELVLRAETASAARR
ncbi:MAG TPA: sigma-70 family RNA polymerase sigma factor [Armatimonadota bacterium]|nr:sigma-70 family RNA polymerase sigma factor [Armatimonadota bacterium]